MFFLKKQISERRCPMDNNMVYKMKEKTGDKISEFAKSVNPGSQNLSGKDAAFAIASCLTPNCIHNGDFRSSDGWFISPENSPKIQFDLVENFVPEIGSPAYKNAIKFTIIQDISEGEEISVLENNKTFGQYSYYEVFFGTYFIIYMAQNYQTIKAKIQRVMRRASQIYTSDINISGGTRPYFNNSFWSEFGGGSVFPMIRLKIVGPISSGTEFYVCYAGCFSGNLILPDINKVNSSLSKITNEAIL